MNKADTGHAVLMRWRRFRRRQKYLILLLLRHNRGNVCATARALGMHASSLRARIRMLGLHDALKRIRSMAPTNMEAA